MADTRNPRIDDRSHDAVMMRALSVGYHGETNDEIAAATGGGSGTAVARQLKRTPGSVSQRTMSLGLRCRSIRRKTA